MSIKSLIKSKTFKKAIAIAVAAACSVGATTYSGHIKYRKMSVSPAQYVKAEAMISDSVLVPLSFIESTTTSVTSMISTASTSTFTTTTTTTETTSSITTNLSTTDVVTSTTTSEVTQPVTEAPTEEVIETPVETSEPSTIEEESVETTTEAPREYVVYKPSTHYIHKNTCRWCNGECYEITSTEGIEARKCTECNPDMEIITPYNPPVQKPTPQQTVSVPSTQIVVSDYEYVMLCNLVAGEYGSNTVSVYDKGAVVATVIHRLWEGTRWTGGMPATIYNVIAAPGQYHGKYLSSTFSSKVTQSCKDAVTYALNNIGEYDYYTNPDGTSIYMINSFSGDGRYNWFRHS